MINIFKEKKEDEMEKKNFLPPLLQEATKGKYFAQYKIIVYYKNIFLFSLHVLLAA